MSQDTDTRVLYWPWILGLPWRVQMHGEGGTTHDGLYRPPKEDQDDRD